MSLLNYLDTKNNSLTLVSELIDLDAKKWNVVKVRNNFHSCIA